LDTRYNILGIYCEKADCKAPRWDETGWFVESLWQSTLSTAALTPLSRLKNEGGPEAELQSKASGVFVDE
jgi:hypothetical protein